MNPKAEPQLAPPGVGLPWPARWIARFLAPIGARRSNWDENLARSERIIARLRDRASALTPQQLSERVLVPRLPGLEDSSRYWSVAMTLDHLNQVTPRMADFIVRLSHGESPRAQVDTAKVKPGVIEDSAKALAEFVETHEHALKRIREETRDRRSKTTQVHPWFGPFTAHQWNWILATHLRIHERQIDAILKGVRHPTVQ